MSESKSGKYERNGEVCWYENGRLHRDNDLPAIEYSNGEKEWYFNGLRHRENGPAVEYRSGYKSWNRYGLLHREDGPAIEHGDGGKEYWMNGKRLTKKEFGEYLKTKKFRDGLETKLQNKTASKKKGKM